MRLVNTTTLELVTKHDDEIPPYAILSHTWGRDEEEVTLQELEKTLGNWNRSDDTGVIAQKIAQRSGFVKIQDGAKLALSQGYDFLWVDTCCIDKTSSAELSEAINSMFRWYQESTVCYAYLSDVDDPVDTNQSPELTREAIIKSRWFTRGWTLQELIAPSVIQFYSRGWVLLGKNSEDEAFLDLLTSASGINRDLLDGSQELGNFSVATRMQWASRRRTTRSEDVAYCLMGLFNVNMPLLYGEGAKAFLRLQEEIIRVTDDQSIFAWKCPNGDPLSNQLSGLLAKTPLWFQDSGHFEPLPTNAVHSAPSSMTSAGLHVELFLRPFKDLAIQTGRNENDVNDDFAALLHCRPHKANGEPVKAALKLQFLGGKHYARRNCDTIFDVDFQDPALMAPHYQYIYVKGNRFRELPDIVIDDLDMTMSPYSKHELAPIWHQQGRWDEVTKTLAFSKSGFGGGILGVLRYRVELQGILSWRTDIIVGMSPKPGPSSYWCFQQTDKEGTYVTAPSPPSGVRLSTTSNHQGVCADVHTDEADHKYNKVTLKLQYIRPSLYASGQSETYVILDEQIPREERHFLVRYLDDLAQEDPFAFDIHTAQRLRRIRRNFEGRISVKIQESLAFMKSLAKYIRGNGKRLGGRWINTSTGREYNYDESLPLRHALKGCLEGSIPGTSYWQNPPSEVINAGFYFEAPLEYWEIEFISTMMNGFCLSHWATFTGNEAFLRLLLSSENGRKTRFLKVRSSSPRHDDLVFGALLREDSTGMTHAEPWFTALHIAAVMGHSRLISMLLDGHEHKWNKVLAPPELLTVEPYHPYDHPIHLAAAYVRAEGVKEVLDCFEQLIKASHPDSRSGWINVARNRMKETPLHRAAAMNNAYAVSTILTHLSNIKDIDCLDYKKRTPLWHAAAANSLDSLRLLIQAGADVNARDHIGTTVLHAACSSGTPAVVEALLAHGADPKACTIVQSAFKGIPFTCLTPCLFAARDGQVDILRLLLAAGADINGPRPSDITPLHVAAANGHVRFVQALRDAGCDLDSRAPFILKCDSKNDAQPRVALMTFPKGETKTALELAKSGRMDATVKYLETGQIDAFSEIVGTEPRIDSEVLAKNKGKAAIKSLQTLSRQLFFKRRERSDTNS